MGYPDTAMCECHHTRDDHGKFAKPDHNRACGIDGCPCTDFYPDPRYTEED